MSTPISPRLLKGGLLLIDPDSGARRGVINLQYNPDTLTRTVAPQGAGADSGDRLEALRLKGVPVETIKLEAEWDAADRLAEGDPVTLAEGLSTDLAALEGVVTPRASDLEVNRILAMVGTIEILPVQAPLAIFVWGRNRVVPVRITEFTITEEAFDPNLNPIRAKVALSLRVLSTNDLPYSSKGGGVYLAHHRRREGLAAQARGDAARFGVEGLP